MEDPPEQHDTTMGINFSSARSYDCKDFTASDVGGSAQISGPSFPTPKTHIVGAALENLGNTCFLNSVLQCLTHTVPLLLRLPSAEHSSSCAGNDGDFCALCALREHVRQCFDQSKQVVSPSNFAHNLSSIRRQLKESDAKHLLRDGFSSQIYSEISSDFKLGMQEDAHEFLLCLLDRLHNCSLDPTMKDKPSSMEEDSLVKQVFGGRLRSQVICCECGHCSDTFEPLLNLSLEIDNAESIKHALDSFTRQEKIDDPEIRFQCDNCSARVAVLKQLKLEQAPPVIVLHLKRFKHTGISTDKIYNFVEYPLELDLKPYLSCTSDNVESFKYDLYAVVVHAGSSAYSGHYYSCIRSSPTTWHDMNDDKITSVPEKTVLNQTAYILFYVRQGSSPWLSSVLEKFAEYEIQSSNSPTSVLDSTERSSPSPSDEEATCSTARERRCKVRHLNPTSDTSVQLRADNLREKEERDATSHPFMEKLAEAEDDSLRPSQVSNRLDDEDEDDVLIPNTSLPRKQEMAAEKPDNDPDTTMDPNFKRYLSHNCTGSRRRQLLFCYSDVTGPPSLTSKIRPLGAKKRRLS